MPFGSSLRRGIRHRFSFGTATAAWDDPLVVFTGSSLINAWGSFNAVRIYGNVEVICFNGQEAGCIGEFATMPLAWVILPCNGCGGEVGRLELLFGPGEV